MREAVLRQSFERHGERLDQSLWGLVREDWWVARARRDGRPGTNRSQARLPAATAHLAESPATLYPLL